MTYDYKKTIVAFLLLSSINCYAWNMDTQLKAVAASVPPDIYQEVLDHNGGVYNQVSQSLMLMVKYNDPKGYYFFLDHNITDRLDVQQEKLNALFNESRSKLINNGMSKITGLGNTARTNDLRNSLNIYDAPDEKYGFANHVNGFGATLELMRLSFDPVQISYEYTGGYKKILGGIPDRAMMCIFQISIEMTDIKAKHYSNCLEYQKDKNSWNIITDHKFWPIQEVEFKQSASAYGSGVGGEKYEYTLQVNKI